MSRPAVTVVPCVIAGHQCPCADCHAQWCRGPLPSWWTSRKLLVVIDWTTLQATHEHCVYVLMLSSGDFNQSSESDLTSLGLCLGRRHARLDVNVIVIMY